MSKITTEECKNYLDHTFPELESSQWKRVRKYKNTLGVWCRDFEHKGGNTITLAEVDGSLVIEGELGGSFDAEKINPTSEMSGVTNNVFMDKKLIAKGRKLVARYVDEDEEIDPSEEGYEAIPASIVFFFCGISDPHQKLTDNFSLSIAVMMFPKEGEFDGEMTGLIKDFLPEYFSEAAECTFTTSFEDPSDVLTPHEIKADLISRGFVYEPEHCSLDQTV